MNVNGKRAAMSGLTDQIRHSVNNPLTSTDFDFTEVLDDVLSTVGLSVTDAGGNVRFYGGADPLIASPFLFASASAVALGAKGVAASAIWRERGGGDQDIAIDIRRAFQRFSGFADGRWEQVNGRPPSLKFNKYNPFGEVPFLPRYPRRAACDCAQCLPGAAPEGPDAPGLRGQRQVDPRGHREAGRR
jgi:hypothetical protein